MSGLNREAWERALADVTNIEIDQEAFTIAELSDLFGTKRSATHERVRALRVEGRVVAVHKYVTDSSGRRCPIPAYRLLEKATTKARTRKRR